MEPVAPVAAPVEAEIDDLATTLQGPEHVYVSTVTNPNAGNQIVTAHRSFDGAQGQVDELADMWKVDRTTLEADVIQLPLLP